MPRRLFCERSTAYTSKDLEHFCKHLGIKQVFVETVTPRANNQVKRMNRSIPSTLMASTEDEDPWGETVSKVKWRINSTVNSATGKSPYEIFFGYRLCSVNDAFRTSEVSCEIQTGLLTLRDSLSQMTNES